MKTRAHHGAIGLFILLVSEALMLSGVRPFTTWFYSLAWWSYIFIVDQDVYRRTGNSLWMSRRREFFLLIPVSVCFWMIFEGLNVYLRNWHYVGIIREPWLRWPGYFIAYGTVLPGIFETAEWLEAVGLFRAVRVRPIPRTTAWHGPFAIIGAVCLFAPVFWPRYTFPLIWAGFTFLLEPLLHTRGGASLMAEWETGRPRTFLLLLTAGLICGVLWEFWNFWAVSKWVYTLPFVGKWKVFEMPVLGFLGFPPFAVELYVMTGVLSLCRGGRGWRREDAVRPGRTRPAIALLWILAFLAVFIMVGRSIDFFTVKAYV